MSKTKGFLMRDKSHQERIKIQNHYLSIAYDLFLNQFKIDGITEEENYYIMMSLWEKGQISAYKIKEINMLIFQDFVGSNFNLYNYPILATIVPRVPMPMIPRTPLEVNKDIVIMYADKARLPIKERVLFYISRIVNIEMLINQNVNSLKMPFLVACTPEDKERLQDVIDRILNDDDLVYLSAEDIQNLKVLITSTPYLLDKLLQAKKERENELLTVLGINNVDIEKKEHLIVDEANANNQLIANHSNIYKVELENFCENVNKILGANLKLHEPEIEIENYDRESEVNENDN